MYAVVEDGSKQYILKQGDVVRLDYRQLEPGETEELKNVLLLKNDSKITVGQPTVEGARVLVTLLHEMGRRNAKKGLATLCIGGGMGIALTVER